MADISLDVSELWPLLPTQQKFIDGIRNAPDSWRDYVYWNVELDVDDA